MLGMNMDLFGVGCKWGEAVHPALACWAKVSVGLPGLESPNYSVMVRLWTCSSRAWLYWRSICSSVWSFLMRSSRRAISVRSLTMSGLAVVARKLGDGGAGGAGLGLGVNASARARGQTDSAGLIS